MSMSATIFAYLQVAAGSLSLILNYNSAAAANFGVLVVILVGALCDAIRESKK